MRKRCHRKIRAKSPPMLVNRGLVERDIEMVERQAVAAFAGGWAGKDHFDPLVDMRNCLTIAAAHKGNEEVLAICDAMRIVMGNIRDRYNKTGRMGVSGDELLMLQEFVGIYRDFWMRCPVSLYEQSMMEMQRALSLGPSPAGGEAS